ncbi:hypothetical protein Trydic_g13263 [Trypoxylus dichotomus]
MNRRVDKSDWERRNNLLLQEFDRQTSAQMSFHPYYRHIRIKINSSFGHGITKSTLTLNEDTTEPIQNPNYSFTLRDNGGGVGMCMIPVSGCNTTNAGGNGIVLSDILTNCPNDLRICSLSLFAHLAKHLYHESLQDFLPSFL